ncbi:YaiI/YqxD family protein [Herbivorax sp. ANBcel31]|uniref:YaiI/YqxD family protein n=1 Tax=Herbivorax sp. ANBcel31 TaxID=3069754 RepID=UPI0027B5BE0F|nr:YaiI/YqxD family protein [Herbivorax sp. ANBcel31]MDQ2084842.1 YaiI/YqxD family protein [Herbivorax sp. ANBcel31]
MKVLVDADACPVKDIIIKVSKKYDIPVIMLVDTCHVIDDNYSKTIVVDKFSDSVDFVLVNKIEKGDVVITQDYGVAAMSLTKGAKVINQNGRVYNNENIDKLLFERHVSQKIRRGGGKISGPSKRKREDDANFEKAFGMLLNSLNFS